MDSLSTSFQILYFFTVLSIELRRNRLDLILKQNLSKGLSHALQRALNDSNAHAQVSIVFTVATGSRSVPNKHILAAPATTPCWE